MSKYHSLRATLNYFDGIFQISRRYDDHILYTLQQGPPCDINLIQSRIIKGFCIADFCYY